MLLLAGCAPHPEVRVHDVYCLTPAQYKALKDAEPAKVGGTLTGNAQTDFKISAEQNVLVRKYADGLLDVLGGCVGAN
jgi:hypothetical protein